MASVEFLRKYRGPGFWVVLAPKWQSAVARIRRQQTDVGPKGAVLVLLGLVFWGGVFGIVHRVLRYFKGVEDIGSLLAAKLLGLAFLAFGSILLLSNLITALSSFFLAKDLDFLAASPVHSVRFYFAKLVETMLHSSWMVALLAVPILTAYGIVYEGGPFYPLIALAAFLPLLAIPAVIGSACTLLLVTMVPARRAKELLSLVAVGAAAALVLLFRVAQPEQLVRPEGFRSLAEFIAVLQAPANPLLPTEWASRTVMNWLLRIGDPLPPTLLWSVAFSAAITSLSTRRARASACFRNVSTRSARPTMIPACGPPSSLSPLNSTRSAPATTLSCTVGSCAIPNCSVASRHPLPRSSNTRTPSVATARNSSSDGAVVNPTTLKFDECTRRNAAVASVVAAS